MTLNQKCEAGSLTYLACLEALEATLNFEVYDIPEEERRQLVDTFLTNLWMQGFIITRVD